MPGAGDSAATTPPGSICYLEATGICRKYSIIAETTWCGGRASPRHRDPYRRVTVVLSGDRLAIEFRDGSETLSWDVTMGEVDWSAPSDRVHRAVNVGKQVFEEVVTFLLDRPDAEPQPEHDSGDAKPQA